MTPKSKGGLGFFNIIDFYYAQKCTTLRRYAKDVTDDLWCDLLDQSLSLSPANRKQVLEWGDLRLQEASTIVPNILKPCFIGRRSLPKNFQQTLARVITHGHANHSSITVTYNHRPQVTAQQEAIGSLYNQENLAFLLTPT